MKIDCTNLGCPQPVIDTKKALEKLEQNDTLEIALNSDTSIENVTRFAKNAGYKVKKEQKDEQCILYISKDTTKIDCECDEKFIDTTLFLKDDKVGEGELGHKLMVGFMSSLLEQDKLPKRIICVNRAIFLTTSDTTSGIGEIFKKLEYKGVEIYSCGVCLSYFNKDKELKVGQVGNAYTTIEMLLKGSVNI